MTPVGVPDPAEVRDLSDVVHNFLGPACDVTDLDAPPCWSLAQRILTSDWLADRDRTRDRELGERIAAAIEAEFERWDALGVTPGAPYPLNSLGWFVERAYAVAAATTRDETGADS